MVSRLELRSLQNISGSIELLPGKTAMDVLEFGSNEISLCLEAPVAEGALVTLQLNFHFGSEKIPCTATGKILSSKEVKTRNYHTRIHLSQIDKQLWQKFLYKVQGKQGRADNIFSSIKGEGS